MRFLLIAVLTCFSGIAFSQPADASWLNVTVQTDQYGGETSWEILSGDSVIITSFPYQDNTLTNNTIPLQAGDYAFVMYDSFGDGICCEFGLGWYSLTNTCGLEIFNYEFSSASDTTEFTLNPCLPVLPGCTDEEANNYNPWATLDSGTCNAASCDEGETLVSMNLTLDNYPAETGFTLVDLSVGEFYEQVFPGEFDFGDQNATFTYDFCVALGFELIVVDGFGDGLNASQWGGIDGAITITACGDTLWELTDIAFEEFEGSTAYSGAVFTEPCPPIPPLFGCMDDDYVDYNPLATAQDTCEVLHTWGCMNPSAFNYDSLATISDNSSPCSITLKLEDDAGDGWGMSGIGVIQGNQQWLFTVGPGQFYETWDLTLDSDEEVGVYYFQDGGQQSSAQELAFQTLHNSILFTNQAGDTLLSEGANPFFNNGQGALKPFRAPEWNIYNFIPHCGDSCEPFTYGCTDNTAQNYDTDINTEDGSCYYQAGCTQAGYLEYYTQGYEADFDNGDCNILAVFGCMDNEAYNYNEEANVETECVPILLGCTNSLAFNFNPAANTDDGNCVPYTYGCTDPTMFNYDSEANTEDGSCIPYIYGCTDSNAINYDPLANSDNDSCIEVVEGCADLEAYNYDSTVNTPYNEACLYEAVGCVTGLGEPYGDGYWLNDMCFAWVIQADPYCCEQEWDNTCQETFDYCSATGIEAILAGDDLVVYPNPVGDVLSINKNVDLDVFDHAGRIIISEINTNVLDASLWTSGIYAIRIVWNNRTTTKRVVKK